MLYLNTDPAPPAAAPCPHDLAELKRDHLPDALVRLASFKQLRRRAAELHLTHPRFREEVPVVLSEEAQRRAALAAGGMRVAGCGPAEAAAHIQPLSVA